MWFIFALCTVLAWGGADLFYKKGSDERDRFSHLKIVVMVGAVMGLHAFAYMLIKGVEFDPVNILRYLPVSFFYITSMTVGYFGLRYLALSISSPVQNSSGAVSAILCTVFFVQTLSGFEILGAVLICAGVFLLALNEKRAEDLERAAAGAAPDRKHTRSFLAIMFPIFYCILDSLGTFLDSVYLGQAESEARFVWLQNIMDNFEVMDEDVALLSYEFTFLICAVLAYIFLRAVKREKFNIFRQGTRAAAACLETAGQFTYVYAMSGRAVIAAPMIASYSIVSLLLSRIFLKEKLTAFQYVIVGIVMAGIAILGFFDA